MAQPGYNFQEYPKWVDGVLVLRAEDDPTVKPAAAAVDGDDFLDLGGETSTGNALQGGAK